MGTTTNAPQFSSTIARPGSICVTRHPSCAVRFRPGIRRGHGLDEREPDDQQEDVDDESDEKGPCAEQHEQGDRADRGTNRDLLPHAPQAGNTEDPEPSSDEARDSLPERPVLPYGNSGVSRLTAVPRGATLLV
jgi:hypothetical protein